MDIINSIISLGASVMMPVIFFIIALCFGVKIGTAFKAGMLVGIGFEGVGLVIGLLLTNLGPASQAMVERIGLQLTVVDTGWPTASTIGWGSPGCVNGMVASHLLCHSGTINRHSLNGALLS